MSVMRYICLGVYSSFNGGTVDTTAHEVLENGMLKELHAATGGDWGGVLVNKAFKGFIMELGKQLIDYSKFAKDHSHANSIKKYFERMYLINYCSDLKSVFSIQLRNEWRTY